MSDRQQRSILRNPLPALGRAIARIPWVMRTGPVVAVLERIVRRLTRGRHGVLDLAGLPSMELTVLGRKSGLPRTVSLLYVPDGPDRYLLVGSNWGRPEHPSWSANLAAASDAEVHTGGRRVKVRVDHLSGAERERAWERAVAYWPGYAMEQRLAGTRRFRLFQLTPI
ncbi:nitroreductase family deazaflavin-dependent oxidoreductase [Nocardia veterana]|uniref:Nitroreductase family deazaflavin-dependent oxidoreductase n=2 Tax=Nocardia veterana TaxID=132249 RepID=A0A7X6LX26_9NOCA|nr:nitroreductase family deazaflavin-dependent oxidoreductase [Nocardia veterana]